MSDPTIMRPICGPSSIQSNKCPGSHWEENMSKRLVLLLGLPAMLAGPALAQNAPNPNQAAAKALLQAADKAIGASNVKSYTITATGWMAYPGQQFAQGDLPRSDLKSFTRTVDYTTKSAKSDYVRVQ